MTQTFRRRWERLLLQSFVVGLIESVIVYGWSDAPGLVRACAILLALLLVFAVALGLIEKVEVGQDFVRVRDLRGVHEFRSGSGSWDLMRNEIGFVRRRPMETLALRGMGSQRADVMLVYYSNRDRSALLNLVGKRLGRAKK